MNMSLAIIIPAYKPDFLAQALESIASQTNKNFSLYIGDDCSPYDLFSIVSKYADRINLSYTRFDVNIGGQTLVAQWERCIALSKNEEYIWLFSDDDVMEPDCVQCFYDTLRQTSKKYDIYHFDINVINCDGETVKSLKTYPDTIDYYTFIKCRWRGVYHNTVVENIFSRDIYEKRGGFQNFDLAWGTDCATWVKFMSNSGMKTIKGAKIYWRTSDLNISPNTSEAVSIRKTKALLDCLIWTNKFCQERGKDCRKVNKFLFVKRMKVFICYIPYDQFIQCLTGFVESHRLSICSKLSIWVVVMFCGLKYSIKESVKDIFRT